MRLSFWLAIIFGCFLWQTSFGQSCGSGKAVFYVFDENGIEEITEYTISFRVVDEDQHWNGDDYIPYGWQLQSFESSVKNEKKNSKPIPFERAYEISASEFDRLLENRRNILEENPQSVVKVSKDSCQNSLTEINVSAKQNKENRLEICTSEGCHLKMVAEIRAEGYQTGYFVSDFICDCNKVYQFRLIRNRPKCLEK